MRSMAADRGEAQDVGGLVHEPADDAADLPPGKGTDHHAGKDPPARGKRPLLGTV
jgi:hypothetical protein